MRRRFHPSLPAQLADGRKEAVALRYCLSPCSYGFRLAASLSKDGGRILIERGIGSAMTSFFIAAGLGIPSGVMLVDELLHAPSRSSFFEFVCVLFAISALFFGYCLREVLTSRTLSWRDSRSDLTIVTRTWPGRSERVYRPNEVQLRVHEVRLYLARGSRYEGWTLLLCMPDQAIALAVLEDATEIRELAEALNLPHFGRVTDGSQLRGEGMSSF